MNNISPERLQTTLDVVGGAFAHNALRRNTPAAECDFERGSAAQSLAYFEGQYAANGNGRNAYGTCVSQKARG
jgi:hypothetical protein